MNTRKNTPTTEDASASPNTHLTAEDEVSEAERTIVQVSERKKTRRGQDIEDINSMKIGELRKKLKDLKLSTLGRKPVLKERLKNYLERADESAEIEDSEADTESENESDESEEDYEYERKARGRRKYERSERGMEMQQYSQFTIKDVEESLSYFTGDDKTSIEKWIRDFEDVSKLLHWNDLQMLIYGKRMLRGSAKQFVASEKGITSWQILRKKLKREFKTSSNSALIHSRLYDRKRLPHETGRQYVYAMREIASEGNVEENALIEYVINGIQDREYNKAILYQSRTLKELKVNLELYDRMKKKSEVKMYHGKKEDVKIQKAGPNKIKKSRCNTCGSPEHDAKSCPNKGKGPKCFKCNNYGHIASKCDEKDKNSTETANANCISRNKATYPMKVNDVAYNVLIDSGSDLSLMRKNVYEEIGSPPSVPSATKITGAGNATTEVLGTFDMDVEVDAETYRVTFFVVPTYSIPHNVILGQDFLKGVDIQIRQGEITQVRKITATTSETTPETRIREAALGTKEADNREFDELKDILYVEKEELDVKSEYKNRLTKLVNNYRPADKVETKVTTTIILNDNIPVNLRPRRLAPKEKAILNKQIDEWLREGVIRPSCSEYASPVVMVPKKNGTYRVCIDYRELNKKIKRDHFPMPLIEDKIDELGNARTFSVIDLKNGFLHVPVVENSVKYTSFVTPDGQYEFLKTPFGLSISAQSFLRFVDEVFRDLIQRKVVFTYVDDVIIPGENDEDAFKRLEETLKVAAANGLTINWGKCQFLQKHIEYLGHEIEDGKVYPGKNKVQAIEKFPEPKCKKHVQSLLGLTGYFRKFVKNYAKIAKPLSDLLKRECEFVWNEEQKHAFLTLRSMLAVKPVLRIYDANAITELHTDASQEGFGAMLVQRSKDEDAFHPVYYYSKKTSEAERKCHSYELEVLAVVNAVKKLRVYLLGIPFKLVTDCEAFKKTLTKKDLPPKVARWALTLEEFEYKVEHRSGTQLKHVDALSRYPVLIIENKLITMIRKKQAEEERLRVIRRIVEKEPYDDYFIENDLLMKRKNGRDLIVVPSCLQTDIIRKAHENGHFSVRKVKEKIESEHYIPALEDKIKKVISCCIPCIVSEKKLGKKEGELKPIPKGNRPLETYHVDHVGPMTTTGKAYRYIFVVIDAFSKFTWLYPTKTVNTKEVIAKLSSQQKVFGNPDRIISDRGTAFTSVEFREYCEEEGIETLRITTGVPRGNGQAERTIRTIIPVITKLSLDDPARWYKHVDRVQMCLNSTYQRATGMSPFEVLFGRKMKNKDDYDVITIIEQETIQLYNENRDELRLLAKENLLKIQQESKRQYDKKCKPARKYKEGDIVFIKRTQFGPQLKIKRKYLGPYKVSRVRRNDRYEVTRIEDGEGPAITSTAVDYMKPFDCYDGIDVSSGTDDMAGMAECENARSERV